MVGLQAWTRCRAALSALVAAATVTSVVESVPGGCRVDAGSVASWNVTVCDLELGFGEVGAVASRLSSPQLADEIAELLHVQPGMAEALDLEGPTVLLTRWHDGCVQVMVSLPSYAVWPSPGASRAHPTAGRPSFVELEAEAAERNRQVAGMVRGYLESVVRSAAGGGRAEATPEPAFVWQGRPVYRPVEGGAVTEPERIGGAAPRYPEAARRARIQGMVVLQVLVTEAGRAARLEVVRGLPLGLTEAAVRAVEGWTFSPATLGGVPVPALHVVKVRFSLADRPG